MFIGKIKDTKGQKEQKKKKGQLNKCGKAGDGEIRLNKCEKREQKMERAYHILIGKRKGVFKVKMKINREIEAFIQSL